MMRSTQLLCLLGLALSTPNTWAFQAPSRTVATSKAPITTTTTTTTLHASSTTKDDVSTQKKKLLGLLGNRDYTESVLADPETKESLRVVAQPGILLGGETSSRSIKYNLISSNNTYQGSSDTYINLLKAVDLKKTSSSSEDDDNNKVVEEVAKRLVPFIPPPLRSPLATAGFPVGDTYVPMRDLFTSPAVSFAYERGWRQNFRSAGFPGPDKEAELAMEYFAPAIEKAGESSTLIDMSCATGKSWP